MDLIFSQPEDVVVPLLVEWLDFIDVARFDKACAFSRRERANLHRAYTTKQVVFHNNVKHLVKTGDHLRWLLQMKIKVAELVVVPQLQTGAWWNPISNRVGPLHALCQLKNITAKSSQ